MDIARKKVNSFATRLTWWIVLTLLVSMSVVAFVVYQLSKSLVEIEETFSYESMRDLTVEKIRRTLSDFYVGTTNHVTEIEESLVQPDSLPSLMERVVRLNKRIRSCGVCFTRDYYPSYGHCFFPYAVKTEEDKVVRLNLGRNTDKYLTDPWFLKALEAKEGYWSDPFFESNDTLTPLVAYQCPLYDRQNRVVAVLSTDLSLVWMRERLADQDITMNMHGWYGDRLKKDQKADSLYDFTKDPNGIYSFIMTKDGTYLVHPDKKRILHDNYFDYARQSADTVATHVGHLMLSGEKGFYCDEDGDIKSFELEGRSCYLFYATIKHTNHWVLAVVVPQSRIEAIAIMVACFMLFLIVLGVVVVFFVSRIIIKRAARPLKQLATSADEVAKGNFQTPLPTIKHNDEIRLLRDSFEDMQQSLTKYINELQTTTASKAAIENELKVAHDIQMSMLPKTFPPFPDRHDIDVSASLTPAKDVGGDLFDFYIRDNKLFFCIGDVSGKGVPASLFMAVTRSLFRNVSTHQNEPNLIVSALNEALAEGNETCMFVTLFVGVLDLDTGLLRYCNAGHDAPLLIGQDVGLLPCEPNLPIGIFSGFEFLVQETVVNPMTTIFLYTDGLNEAEDIRHEQFENRRVLEVAGKLLAEGKNQPKTIVEQMAVAVHSFVGEAEQSDDLTMLAIKYRK